MKSAALIERYRSVQTVAEKMLGLAQQGAWTEVATVAKQINDLTGSMRSLDPDRILTKPAQVERGRILVSLVQIDGQIRQLREPWTLKLESLLRHRV